MSGIPRLQIIPAGAGSGKTYTIQTTLARWVREGRVQPERIAAVTFTRAAANELRERIRAQLVDDGLMEQALRLDDAWIGTIHGFGLRLLTEFAFDAGISPTLRELEDKERAVLLRRAVSRSRGLAAITRDLRRFGYRTSKNHATGGYTSAEEQLLGDLDRAIAKLRAIGTAGPEQRLLDASGAALRDGYGPTGDPQGLTDALRRAVAAILKRFPGDPSPEFSGFKTVEAKVRADHRALRRAAEGSVLETDWGLWIDLAGLRTLANSRAGKSLDWTAEYDALAEAVRDAAAMLPAHPGPLDDALRHSDELLGGAMSAIAEYQEMKRQSGLVDYGDMLGIARALMGDNSAVIQDLSSRLDCLVVDEFQDTNPIQFSLLMRIHEAGVPLTVVGDRKQAIFGFQEADHRLLDALERSHPEARTPLTGNWRTTPPLMRCLNAIGRGLFGEAYQDLDPKVVETTPQVFLECLDLEGSRNQAARAAATAVYVKDLAASETTVFDKRLGARRPIRPGDIALLFRRNAHRDLYAAALRRAGIRTRIAAVGWCSSRVVQLLLHALAWVADGRDRHAALVLAVTELGEHHLEGALETLLDGGTLNDAVVVDLTRLREDGATASVDQLVDRVVEVLGLHRLIAAWPEPARERSCLLRFVQEARVFLSQHPQTLASQAIHGRGLRSFLAWIPLRAEEDDTIPAPRPVDDDAVELCSWHKAKGREWPVVVLCELGTDYAARLSDISVDFEGFDDPAGLLERAVVRYTPSFPAKELNARFLEPLSEEAEDEARRLLYVALTRARERLVLHWGPRGHGAGTLGGILAEAAGLRLDGNELHVGDQIFEAAVARYDPEDTEESSSEAQALIRPNRRAAVPSRPTPPLGPPEQQSPSSLEAWEGTPTPTALHEEVGPPLALPDHAPAEVLG
ncbi:MAG: UvrD-helicase domain-containing protein, partial [Pseudomonadota bacterium]